MTRFIDLVDRFINPLIWTSIILLFVELGFGTQNSLDSKMWLFLWCERLTAIIFMLEYFCRWIEDEHNPEGHLDIGHHYYPLSVMGIIDLLAWLPFLIGFFIPIHLLGWVRALRVLRVLKLFRYSRVLQLFALAIYKSLWFLKAVFFVIVCSGLLAAVLIREAERSVQPENFDNLFTVFYFIATADSTVGFGDVTPKTDLGRLLTILLIYIPGIAVFGSVIGIIGNSLSEVMVMERNPNIDPIEEFKKEYTLRHKVY